MLLIDQGNTAVKCRLEPGQQDSSNSFSLQDPAARDELVELLKTLAVKKVYLASVSGEDARQQLRTIIAQCLPAAELKELFTLPALGAVRNAYREPGRLGVDRWLTLLGARELASSDAIVIDAGSAITIDLLSRQRGHLGGAILPGFNTSLARFKSLFPHVDYHHPEISQNDVPGRSTEACIQLEPYPVDEQRVQVIVDQWLPLLQQPVEVLICGQDGARVAAMIRQTSRIVPDLVFTGMLHQIRLAG